MELKEAYLILKERMPNKAQKLEICREFDLKETAKTQEIINQILELLREERVSKECFTDEDAQFFFRLCRYTSYNKMKTYLELESRKFVNFLIEWYENRYKVSKLRNKWPISLADGDKIKTMESMERFIRETSTEWAIREKRIADCANILRTQLQGFKRKFLKAGESLAVLHWNGEKNHLWSLDEFVKRELDNRERYYNFAILSLAERLVRNGVDENNLTVNFIKEDMKLFEMSIYDGKNSWHARSIIAAEWSAYMNCHIRFIVTKTN